MASLFAEDRLGQFIPQYFAETVIRERVKNVSDEDWKTLEAGPDDNEWYWEAWNNVLSNAIIAKDDESGFLYQDGDLWIIWGDNDPDYENLIGEAP